MNHTELDLERTLAYHGAPAMAGIKSADLIAWGSPEACSTPPLPSVPASAGPAGHPAAGNLDRLSPGCLLLVYRPDRLERQLNGPGGAGTAPAGGATRPRAAWRPCWRPSAAV